MRLRGRSASLGNEVRRPSLSGKNATDFTHWRNEGMRPVCGLSQSGDGGTMPFAEFEAQSIGIPAESVPAECPGLFIEQPLERWSPRDLIVGMLRLVRWTRLATS
jgi:hypothetical protein